MVWKESRERTRGPSPQSNSMMDAGSETTQIRALCGSLPHPSMRNIFILLPGKNRTWFSWLCVWRTLELVCGKKRAGSCHGMAFSAFMLNLNESMRLEWRRR
jgi:hypothetical protein